MELIDFLADKVQTFTGEKDRRNMVGDLKKTYNDYKVNLINKINSVNEDIEGLNQSIEALNNCRFSGIPDKLEKLCDFLGIFGHIKEIGNYADEETARLVEIPVQNMKKKEDYLVEIDWSKGEVFVNTIIRGPIGTRIKTKKQNLSLQEQLNLLKHEAEQSVKELEHLQFSAKQDKQIVEIYIMCINAIIEYIERVIIPELDIVKAFFQARVLSNRIISDIPMENVSFDYCIEVLNETPYHEHYQFIKNTFMFYVISCKIYNTPVLTNLFKKTASKEDLDEIMREKQLMEDQMKIVGQYLMFKRGA